MFSSSYQFFSWAELKDIFRKFGEVTYTDAHYRSGDGRGEVCFATREEQDRCLDEAEGMDINGRSNQSILSAIFKVLLFSGIRVSAGQGADQGRDRGRRDSRSRSRSRSRGRGGRGGGGDRRGDRSRPHRTEFTLGVDNLSSRCE